MKNNSAAEGGCISCAFWLPYTENDIPDLPKGEQCGEEMEEDGIPNFGECRRRPPVLGMSGWHKADDGKWYLQANTFPITENSDFCAEYQDGE